MLRYGVGYDRRSLDAEVIFVSRQMQALSAASLERVGTVFFYVYENK